MGKSQCQQDSDYNLVISFLNRFKNVRRIYPDAIQRSTGVSESRVLEILESYEKSGGTIKRKYVMRCPLCQQLGSTYDSIIDMPSFINCVNCGEETERDINSVVIIYEHR